jgi:hypothetical protein
MLGDRIDRADRARENRVNAQGLTRLLGLLSLGMGVALVAPRALGRLLGLGGERPWLLRAIAARDVAIGIGLLGSPDPTPWLRAQAAAGARQPCAGDPLARLRVRDGGAGGVAECESRVASRGS